MNVPIPAEFQEFVDDVIRSGNFHSEAEVVSEALRLLRKREQLRREVNAGIEQLDEGEGIEGDEVFERLERKTEDITRQTAAQDQ